MLNGLAICAGYGGLELALGIVSRDYQCVAYIEREAFAASALVARMADKTLHKAPIWDDLTTFSGSEWRGVVDIVTAGFPCQPWSGAGKRQGTDDDRWLWPQIHRIICDTDPEWVFLENVPGLKNGGLGFVLGDLSLSGFDAEWDCFTAAQVGAPHLRERLFILAHARRISGGGIQPNGLPRRSQEARTLASSKAVAVDSGDRRHQEWDGAEQQERVADAGEPSLGHPKSRLQGRAEPLGDCADEWASWPPGPSDADRWSDWPESLKPAVRGTPNGTAAHQIWMDRLHACGNGVVPQVAALALVVLSRRLGRTLTAAC